MRHRDYLIEPSRLTAACGSVPLPVAVLALESGEPCDPAGLAPPPCPLIGLGDPHHALAELCDVVVEPPIGIDAIVENVLRHPLTAAATVQLLRLLPSLTATQGLDVESLAYAMLQGSGEHEAWLASRPGVAQSSAGNIVLHRRGARLDIVLDRPEAANAINTKIRDGLAEAFSLASLDDEIEEVRWRANGRAFSLGADLDEFGTTRDPATAHDIRMHSLPARQVLRCAQKLRVEIDGACVGAGLELAAFAHRIEATSRAWFHLPELAMGILPGAGGCVSLTRRIGRQRTALMILSGRRLSARKALEWGLVDALVDAFPGDESCDDVLG